MSDLLTIECEQNVIGCAMHEPAHCDEAFERLKADHFSSPFYSRCWQLILDRVKAGASPDPVSLMEHLKGDADFAELGGVRHLADLVDRALLWPLTDHIGQVLDRSARRDILSLTKHVQGQAQDTGFGTAETVLAELERGAAVIARDGASKPHSVPVGLTALEMLEAARRGDFKGVSVGLDCIDHVTGGIKSDDVWFLGGRTSMGKSVLGLCLGKGIAAQGLGVQMFSLEMGLKEVQARLTADLAHEPHLHYEGGNVRYGDLLKGRTDGEQWSRAERGARALASLPFNVDDRGGLTIDDIRIHAQRQFRSWEKAGLKRGAVIIDHIGLVKPTRKTDNKAADTADTVNELKSLAKQLGAPIIALCQINRSPEGRLDKRPQMSDMNWSGAIEQIADFVCLLYREAYYQLRAGEDVTKPFDLELLIQKNRSGPVCTLHAYCDVASNAVRDNPREDGRQYA